MKLFRRTRRVLRWSLRLLLIVLVADLIYVATIWPDWKRLARGAVPKSSFLTQYEAQRQEQDWPRARWQPVALNKIPKHVVRAIVVAEDSRFYTHSGFDVIAIREAWDYNVNEGRMAFGASTISQQTAKNLFLTPARTPWRKWHEALLTVGLEQNLSKSRILELYLNVAEFGRGIYGVEAAAQHYWGTPVAKLSVMQAAELAASLPGPTKHNPQTRTEYFERRSKKILAWLGREFETAPAFHSPLPTRDELFLPPPPPIETDAPPTQAI